MNEREARKRLLIAEGDLLRAGLRQDLAALGESARSFHARTASLAAAIATMADLAGALFGRRRSPPQPTSPSIWWRILHSVSELAVDLWRRRRARSDDAHPR